MRKVAGQKVSPLNTVLNRNLLHEDECTPKLTGLRMMYKKYAAAANPTAATIVRPPNDPSFELPLGFADFGFEGMFQRKPSRPAVRMTQCRAAAAGPGITQAVELNMER